MRIIRLLFFCLLIGLLPTSSALGDAGQARVQELVRKLNHGDAKSRWNAASGLAYTAKYSEISIPALTRALSDSDSNVRSKAAESLRKIKSASARKAPQKHTPPPQTPPAQHRPPPREVVHQQPLPPKAEPDAAQIHAARTEARERIERNRKRAEETKLAKKRELAAEKQRNTEAETLKLAVRAREEKWSSILEQSQKAFWQKSTLDASLAEELRVGLSSEQAPVQSVAALACAFVPSTSKSSLRKLIELLSAKQPKTRANAALAIGQLKAAGKPAVRYLSRTLLDTDPLVRRRSAEALGLIGHGARATASALSLLIEDTSEAKDVRIASTVALGRLGQRSDDASSSLLLALESDDLLLKSFAASSLGEIGYYSEETVAKLTAAKGSKDMEVTRAATWALGVIETQKSK